jgi:glycosyltransferase involved in cell wall biosynthesis
VALSDLLAVPGVLWNRARSLAGRRVFFTSDQANWAIDWHVRYTAESLRERHGVPVVLTKRSLGLRGQIVHAFDRYSFLRGRLHARLHESNDLFLTWMHVDPEMSQAEAELIRRELPAASARLRSLVVTCAEGREAITRLGADPSRLTVIPLGVDTERFRPPTPAQREAARAALGIPAGAFAIGSFVKDGQGWGDGNEPKRIKGPDILLAVLERMQREVPNVFMVLSGPARGFVKAGLDRLGIPFAHRYQAHYHQLVDLYHALDLYLIPSRGEGGPLTFGESWAMGVPVVSTRMGMPADYIVPGENGYLAEVDDVEGLAAHTLRLMADPAHRAALAARGLQDVARIAWPEVARQHYVHLYQPIL